MNPSPPSQQPRSPWLLLGIVMVACTVLLILSTQPSNSRQWSGDHEVLVHTEVDGERVMIYNVRNFSHSNSSEHTLHYYNASYNLSNLDSVWFVVKPISDWEGAAHTFVSFGFGERYIAVSVEARREAHESYSSVAGLLRQYELLYVWGDEQDVVRLRTLQDHPTYLYRVNTTPEHMRALFLDMVARTNQLHTEPELYNTLLNSCTTNVADHVNTIVPGRVPLNYRLFASGYSDEYAYELGLIQTNVPLEELRAQHDINARSLGFEGGDYSAWIRSSVQQPVSAE